MSVQLPKGVGGGAFATYWPFAQGLQAQITEGPGGRYSHYTVYTWDAVDVGVPTGTEIHAGFTGVVARVNTGCTVGNHSCGNGYGNYIYLKASDGSCAVMAHLSRVNVSFGQQITVYDVVGLSGNTGNSSGPHLHYDRVNCVNNRSMPWSPIEGGSLREGAVIVSQNHPPGQPCLALQGGCSGPIQGGNTPIQGSSPPLQGGGPGAGGGSSPPPTVALSQGPAAPAGYRYAITLQHFAPNHSVTITCFDSVSPGGFYSFGLTTDANGSAATASYCYSGDGPDHWVTADGVVSNHVTWSAPPPPPPPPPPATYSETVGGVTHTWTNYTNAGGTQGPSIQTYQTVQVGCKVQGFRVADGDTWWYKVVSSPWNGAYFASADAFYNNGQTSGSLHGTPFVDPNVPDC